MLGAEGMKRKDPSQIKKANSLRERYGQDYYTRLAQKRWERPGERERSAELFDSEKGRRAALRRWSKVKVNKGEEQ